MDEEIAAAEEDQVRSLLVDSPQDVFEGRVGRRRRGRVGADDGDELFGDEDARFGGEGLVAEEGCGQGKLAPLLGNDKQRALDHTHHQSSESSVMHGGQPPMRIRITQRPVAARKKVSTPH